MAKAAGNAAKARATASTKAPGARKGRKKSPANEVANEPPASATSAEAVAAPNEPNEPATGDDQPDEEELLADVSSIIDPLVTLAESAPGASPPSAQQQPTAAPDVTAQLLARQHAEYQRSVELVRQQLAHRHMQQMQQAQQQHLQLQRQQQSQPPVYTTPAVSAPMAATTSASVMHHVQQRLHERIQHKELFDQMRQQATTPAATEQQLQIQQYHRMIRELEMQAAAAAVASAASSSATSTSAGLNEQELERMRQERLQRLHHMQLQKMQEQQQHLQMQAQALRVTLTGVPPAAPVDPRTQMHVDLERLRQLHQQQQLRSQAAQAALAAPQASPSPKPLQVDTQLKMTKPPAKKRAADQEKETTADVGSAASSASATPATSPAAGSAPLKKKRKTPAESQMEALVRVLCRLQLSKNESEMRTQLEKLSAWITKCGDSCLVRFALRDFVEIFGVKLKQFSKSPQWQTDLLPKCTFTHDKLRHAIAALDQTAAPKPASESNTSEPTASQGAAVATAASKATPKTTPASDAITQAAREHAYAALKEQMLATLVQSKRGTVTLTKAVASTTTGSAAGAVTVTPTPTTVTSGTGNANTQTKSPEAGATDSAMTSKRHDLSIQVDTNTTPKALGTAAVATASHATAAMALAKAIPPLRPTPAPTPTNTIISPRVAQHLFDLDLAPRSCAVAPDEGEERFYLPTKLIASIMRRVLPGGGPPPMRRKRRKRRTAMDLDSVNGDGTTSKKKNDDDDDDDDEGDGDDAEGEGVADDGDDNEDEETKLDKDSDRPASAAPAISAVALDEPPIKIDDEALTFMQECVTEFLLFFTSEARDQAAYEKKKGSITGLNLIHSLENLGFSPYAKVLTNYNDKVRKVQDEAAHQKQERKNLAKARKLQAEQELLKQREEEQAKLVTAASGVEMKQEIPTPTNGGGAVTQGAGSASAVATAGAPAPATL